MEHLLEDLEQAESRHPCCQGDYKTSMREYSKERLAQSRLQVWALISNRLVLRRATASTVRNNSPKSNGFAT